jgi:hypothetical protein
VKTLVVWHHPGLGDHLICNGLVNTLADEHDVVYVPCKRHYLDTVRSLYSEQPRVQPFPVDEWPHDVERFSREKGCEILRVGHEQTDPSLFDASFYRQLNIPFDVRYTRFALPRIIPHEQELYERLAPAGGAYCLVHREGSVGIYDLTFASTLPVIYVDHRTNPFNNLLAYRRLICDATEIHCINSSVLHLVDGLPTRAALFYHAVRATDFTLRPRWTVVAYGSHPVQRLWRNAAARSRLIRAQLF